MKRKGFIIIALILAMLCSFGVFACAGASEGNIYMVTFNANGGTFDDGTPINLQSVKEGETPDIKTPVREGYTFSGWYEDLAATNVVDWAVTTITSDVTFYAGWAMKEERFGVTFDLNYDGAPGGGVYMSKVVDNGGKVDKPANPTRDGYTFVKWTLDKSGNNEWDFSAATVNSAIRLYAQWEQNKEKTLTGISVTSPTKTEYKTGETFSAAGLVVTAHYDISGDEVITSGYELSSPDMTTAGEKTIIVTYGGKTATFNITVVAAKLASIVIEKTPTKLTYVVGQEIDKTGMAVKAVYDNGKEEAAELSACSVSADTSAVGKVTVTVTYSGKTATFDITVVEKSIVSIAISGTLTGSFAVGDPFDPAGLVFTATYNDGTTAALGAEDMTFSSPALDLSGVFKTSGKAEITFACGNVAATPAVEVQVSAGAPDELTALTVSGALAKTSFKVGEHFDSAGLTFTATYSVSGAQPVSASSITFVYSGFDEDNKFTVAGDVQITAQLNGVAAAEKISVTVTDEPLSQFTVTFSYNYDGAPDGGVYTTSSVTEGNTVANPDQPVRTGYTFMGWCLDQAGQTAYSFDSYVSKDTTLYASWDRNPPVLTGITVDASGARVVYTVGETIDKTGLVVKAVYDYGDDVALGEGDYSVSADLTSAGTKQATVTYNGMEADYSITVNEPSAKVTVTFYYNYSNTSNEVYKTETGIDRNGTVEKPATDPTRLGYTFECWCTDRAGNSAYVFGTPIAFDLSLYAKWTPDTYTVTFVIGEHGNPPAPATQNIVYSDTAKAVRPANPTSSGDYNFECWEIEDAGGERTAYDFDTAITASITLYAKWSQKVFHTVTFNLDGGSPAIAARDIEHGMTLGELPTVTKTGYNFVEWQWQGKAFNLETPIENDGMVITAVWKVHKWTLKYVVDGGETNKGEIEYGTLVSTLGVPATAKAGYTFVGWKDGGEAVNMATLTMPDRALTLTAYWTINTHTVTFIVDGAEKVIENVEYGTQISTLDVPNTAKPGYTFTGWKDGEDNDFVLTTTMPDHDLTLTAQYTIKTFTVTFDANKPVGAEWGDPTATVAKTGVEYNTTITKPADPTLVGYNFGGWFKDAACENVWTFGPEGDRVTEAITLYAKWTIKTFTVTFHRNAGEAITAERTVNYGATAVSAPEFTRLGYTFVGWYNNAGGTGDAVNFAAAGGITENRTVYAKWNIIDYSIVYKNGGETVVIDGNPTTLNVASAEQAVANGPAPETGYRFIGWYTAGEGGDLVESVSGAYIGADTPTTITLYARFSDMWKITFNANNGTFLGDKTSIVVEVKYNTAIATKDIPDEPTRLGYDFKHWYLVTDPQTEKPEFDLATNILTDITLKAYWTENPADGIYMRASTDNWNTITLYPGDYNRDDKGAIKTDSYGKNEYKFENIPLTLNFIYQIVVYEEGTAKYIKANESIGNTSTPENYVTVTPVADSYGGHNFKVTAYNSELEGRYWTVYTNSGFSNPVLESDLQSRGPDGETFVATPATETADVYFRGDFSFGKLNESESAWLATDIWSSDSAVMPTALADGKYYFGDVHLRSYTEFKLYVKNSVIGEAGEGYTWLGGDYASVGAAIAVANKVPETEKDANNINFIGANGSYDIVFDSNAMTLTIYAHNALTATIKGGSHVFVGRTPQISDFDFTYAGGALGAAQLENVTLTGAVAVEGANTIKVRYQNTVAFITYEATIVVPVSVSAVLKSSDKIYLGDHLGNNDFTVTLTKNDGSNEVITSNFSADVTIPAATDETISTSDRFVAGSVPVTVTYGMITPYVFNIDVYNKLTGLSVEGPDNKTYVSGTAFNTEGLTVYAVFNNNNNVKQVLMSGYTIVGLTDGKIVNSNVSVSYTADDITVEAAITGLIVTEPVITAITVSGTPTTAAYTIGQSFNFAGLTIRATLNNATTRELTSAERAKLAPVYTDMNYSYFTSVSQTSVSFTYDGGVVAVTGSAAVTVTDKLTSIEIMAQPTPPSTPANHIASWVVGDSFALTGMVVKATYNTGIAGALEVIDNNFVAYTTSIAVGTALSVSTTVYVTATIDDSITANFDLTVVPLSTLWVTVSGTPTKTTYLVGEKFDPAGLTFTATYNNGTTEVISNQVVTFTNAEYFNASQQFKKAGASVAIGFSAHAAESKGTIPAVTVNNRLTSVEVLSIPTPPSTPGHIASWVNGDALSLVGMRVRLYYNAGVVGSETNEELAVTDANKGGFSGDISKALKTGENTYNLSYGGCSFDLVINAVARVMTGFTVTGTPAEQFLHATFNTSGLVFTAAYNNGDEETVSIGITFTSSALGNDNRFNTSGASITVTATYGGISANIIVTVTNDTRFTVSFNTGAGGSAVSSQSILEGGKAEKPADPTRKGFDFIEWRLDGVIFDFDNTVITDSIELVAVWNAKTYTIVYTLPTGAPIATDGGNSTSHPTYTAVEDNFESVALADGSRSHHTFVGWYAASDFSGAKVEELTYALLDKAVGVTITLYARFTPVTYNVTFVYNNSTSSKTVDVVYNATTGKVTAGDAGTFSYSGHTFVGWYTDKELTNSYDFDTIVEASFSLYAKWEDTVYTVTFDANGGDFGTLGAGWTVSGDKHTATIDVVHNGKASAPTAPTKAPAGTKRYEFASWHLVVDDVMQGAAFNFATTSITAPITLKAKWNELDNTVRITFDINLPSDIILGQTAAAPAAADYIINSSLKAVALASNTVTCYTFLGWSANSAATEPDDVLTADVVKTVYAVWSGKAITVTFDANSGALTGAATQDGTYGKALSTGAIAAEPTRTGYIFAGWFTATTDGVQIATTTALNMTAAPTLNTGGGVWTLTLYAQWTAKSVTVTLNANGGTVNPASITVTYDSTYGALATPTKTGYAFDGWFTTAIDGTAVTASTSVTNDSAHTIYAHWSRIRVTLNHNYMGAPADIVLDASESDGKVTAPDNPVRLRYSFTGWMTTSSGSTVFDFAVAPMANTTIYAKWEEKSFTPGVYVDDTLVKGLTENSSNSSEYKAEKVLVMPGQIVGFYTDKTSELTVISGTKWLTFEGRDGGAKDNFQRNTTYGGVELASGKATGVFNFYYQKKGGGTIYIESAGTYVAPDANLGGIYSGNTLLKAFEINYGALNEIMATRVTFTEQTTVSLKYGGNTKSPTVNGAASGSGTTITVPKGTLSFYYSYSSDQNTLYVGFSDVSITSEQFGLVFGDGLVIFDVGTVISNPCKFHMWNSISSADFPGDVVNQGSYNLYLSKVSSSLIGLIISEKNNGSYVKKTGNVTFPDKGSAQAGKCYTISMPWKDQAVALTDSEVSDIAGYK